jgi:hypothetical protein
MKLKLDRQPVDSQLQSRIDSRATRISTVYDFQSTRLLKAQAALRSGHWYEILRVPGKVERQELLSWNHLSFRGSATPRSAYATTHTNFLHLRTPCMALAEWASL